jgi:hypothetical protein
MFIYTYCRLKSHDFLRMNYSPGTSVLAFLKLLVRFWIVLVGLIVVQILQTRLLLCLISVLVIVYNVTSRKHNPSLFNPVELRIILIAMSLLSFRFGLLFITASLHKVNVGLEWISNEISLSKVWICFALASISAISRSILDNPKRWVCLPILSLKMHPFSFF